MNQSDFISNLQAQRHTVVQRMIYRSSVGRAPQPNDQRWLLTFGLLTKQAALFTRNERQEIVDSLKKANV